MDWIVKMCDASFVKDFERMAHPEHQVTAMSVTIGSTEPQGCGKRRSHGDELGVRMTCFQNDLEGQMKSG